MPSRYPSKRDTRKKDSLIYPKINSDNCLGSESPNMRLLILSQQNPSPLSQCCSACCSRQVDQQNPRFQQCRSFREKFPALGKASPAWHSRESCQGQAPCVLCCKRQQENASSALLEGPQALLCPLEPTAQQTH